MLTGTNLTWCPGTGHAALVWTHLLCLSRSPCTVTQRPPLIQGHGWQTALVVGVDSEPGPPQGRAVGLVRGRGREFTGMLVSSGLGCLTTRTALPSVGSPPRGVRWQPVRPLLYSAPHTVGTQ